MKTLKEVFEEAGSKAEFVNGFIAGVEFAQKWTIVEDEIPPSDTLLLVKSPNGEIHLCEWRPLHDIFTVQCKDESAMDWQWRLIEIK